MAFSTRLEFKWILPFDHEICERFEVNWWPSYQIKNWEGMSEERTSIYLDYRMRLTVDEARQWERTFWAEHRDGRSEQLHLHRRILRHLRRTRHLKHIEVLVYEWESGFET